MPHFIIINIPVLLETHHFDPAPALASSNKNAVATVPAATPFSVRIYHDLTSCLARKEFAPC
jgi:hypothetical protein